MRKVTNQTRADKRGTAIFCPRCGEAEIITSFKWDKLECGHCKKITKKKHWQYDEFMPVRADALRNLLLYYVKPDIIEAIINKPAVQNIIDSVISSIQQFPDFLLESTLDACLECESNLNLPKFQKIRNAASRAVGSMYLVLERNNSKE